MKVQQTLAQTWKRRRDSDHAEAKRLAGVTEMDALVDVRWTRGNWAGYAERQNAPSTLRAQFRWSGPDDHVDMSLTDACMTLEHWVDWRG